MPDQQGSEDAPADDDLHHVSSADDVAPGERAIAEVEGVEIAVFNVDGDYHAMANYCVHQGGPVAEGLVSGEITCEMTDDDWDLYYDREDELVACPWHGWQFEIATGEHTAGSNYCLPTFDIVNRDGELYVEL